MLFSIADLLLSNTLVKLNMRSSRSLGPLSLISSTWNRQLFVSLYSYYILTMWITKLINNVFIHNSLYQLMELSYQEKSG